MCHARCKDEDVPRRRQSIFNTILCFSPTDASEDELILADELMPNGFRCRAEIP